ncbi:MAG TPA: biotin--[acetyl-CoA-carboxylase] ligase, partial [Crocinitomicaceae bacterium]|nr:biotin--[acetyl-CoA-carboxylase] ligase [Crocinitomicaceae bacterium]
MKIGNKIVRLASVDSTNNYIANLVKEREITSGTVVLADEQFLGKGQRGSEWTTNAGENLTFSFFLDNVNLSVENQFILTQLVSLSLIELLDKLNVKAKIKWPNDIYIDSTKVAGVLIENQLSFGQIKSSVIGIGLNVNQKKFDGFNATSLFLENEVHHSLMDILLSFI